MVSLWGLGIQRLLILSIVERDSCERLGLVVVSPSVIKDSVSSFFQSFLLLVIEFKLMDIFYLSRLNLNLESLLVSQGRPMRAIHELLHFLVHHLALLEWTWKLLFV